MTLYKDVTGEGKVPMSAQEEAETRVEWAANDAKAKVKNPKPDLAAAIRALIAGDMVAAQAAMDKME